MQTELQLAEKPRQLPMDPATVQVQPDFMAAINLCISLSGLKDKQVYMSLQIDAGHWTRIKNGDAHFPLNKLTALMKLCGNDAPLQWLAFQCGYKLEPLRSELERRLLEAEQRAIRAEEKLNTILEYEAAKQGRRG